LVAQPLQADTNVLGYTLKARIGSGGFGEVWSAEAPGGIMKALKIVYGFHDEKRAQAELKALDRVKTLRHPFLLNLERIEVYEGQLVVVTELADKSMADLFNECILDGEAGIPREKILQYVRDAGDALDYMSSEQGLQHLDIKPENLLMVSGHVKVADFGLIKDLHNASQSMMQGMTPAYAAPELFDGRPGTRSDQYSLAIVYQEMLTGVRPFPGTTPAQLAAQHMHGKPNLRSLPKSDQPIIAKALAKDPEHRFKTCREMADELISRRRIKKKAVRRIREVRPTSDTETGTAVFDSGTNDFTNLLTQTGTPYLSSPISTMDPPLCDAAAATFRPTIVIGVGGTANRVVKRLKQQLSTRYGSMDLLPAFKVVCIDSDRSALMTMASQSESVELKLDETLPVPLRKPEAYRDHAAKFKWLSRRWIYNVPRSLQTEGLRPLGRLAFADHFDSIWNSLSESLDALTLPENLATTCETVGLNPGKIDVPRVIVVSTISGGIGSGMTLDLAYTLRLLMAEKAMKADSLTGILLHAAYRRDRDPGLAAANAFAFMTELRHYNDSGYEGDVSLGIPEFEDQSPFEFTYYRDLGRDLKQSDFDNKLSGVAEYIGLGSISNCNVFFDACREKEKELEHFALRSFGLSVSGPGVHGLGEMAVNRLSRGLLSRWIFGAAGDGEEAATFVERTFSKFNLSNDAIFKGVQRETKKIVTEEKVRDAVSQMQGLLGQKASLNLELQLMKVMDDLYGPANESSNDSSQDTMVCLELDNFIGQAAISGGNELSLEFMELLNRDTLDLGLVDKCVSTSQERLGEWSLALGQQLSDEQKNLRSLLSAAVGKKTKEGDMALLLQEYVRRREHFFFLKYAKEYTRVLNRSLNSAAAVTHKFKSHLQTIAAEFPKESDLSSFVSEDGFNMDCLMNDSIHSDLESQISRTEIQVYTSLIQDRGGFAESLNKSAVWQHRLPGEIRIAAQRVLADAYQKLCLDKITIESGVAPEQLISWLNHKISVARPEINNCGGSQRMMLGLPTFSEANAVVHLVENHFQMKQKAIKGTYGNFVICFECEDVSLASVAFRLLEDRPDAVDLVKRIHSRGDIEWLSLADLL